MGSKKARLFTRFPDGGDWRSNAVVGGGWTDDAGLAMGYADLGLIGLRKIVDEGPDDGLFIPALYCPRHAFELVLKSAIRDTARIIRQDDDMHGRPSRPRLEATRLDADLGNEHGIGPLVNRLAHLLRDIGLEPVPAAIVRTVLSLHDEDPSGQGLRYADVFEITKDSLGRPVRGRNGKVMRVLRPAMPDQLDVNVAAVAAQLQEAFDLLSGGLLTYLGAALDTQDGMRAEYEAFAREAQAEVDAEMRAELESDARYYEAEMRAEYEAEMRAAYEMDYV